MTDAAKDAQAEYARRWRERNPEKYKAAQKRWRENNREKVREIQRRYWTRKAAEKRGEQP